MKRATPEESEIQKATLYHGIFIGAHWRDGSEYDGKHWFMRFGAVGSPDIFALDDTVLYRSASGPAVSGATPRKSSKCD